MDRQFDIRRETQRFLQQLPQNEALLYHLIFREGLSVEEFNDRLLQLGLTPISPSTLRTRKWRLRQRLAKILGEL